MWHIINTKTNTILETWWSENKARYFCQVVNRHEIKNNRMPVYIVKEAAK